MKIIEIEGKPLSVKGDMNIKLSHDDVIVLTMAMTAIIAQKSGQKEAAEDLMTSLDTFLHEYGQDSAVDLVGKLNLAHSEFHKNKSKDAGLN